MNTCENATMSERAKNMFQVWEDEMNGRDASVRELFDVMCERGPAFVEKWMEFSGQMVEKLETSTIDEYDEWRVKNGCIPLFRSVRNKGKEVLLKKLQMQREIDLSAYFGYMVR